VKKDPTWAALNGNQVQLNSSLNIKNGNGRMLMAVYYNLGLWPLWTPFFSPLPDSQQTIPPEVKNLSVSLNPGKLSLISRIPQHLKTSSKAPCFWLTTGRSPLA
jgi:hypothetical protein